MNTILITGASSGIGKATALRFQSEGWNVVATMRDPSAGHELERLDRVAVTRLDVTNAATIDAVKKHPAAYPSVLSVSSHKGDGLEDLRGTMAQVIAV